MIGKVGSLYCFSKWFYIHNTNLSWECRLCLIFSIKTLCFNRITLVYSVLRIPKERVVFECVFWVHFLFGQIYLRWHKTTEYVPCKLVCTYFKTVFLCVFLYTILLTFILILNSYYLYVLYLNMPWTQNVDPCDGMWLMNKERKMAGKEAVVA
jgi:hypothetical protein